MKLICSNINLLKAPFEAITSIVSECEMIINEKGLQLDAIDSTHIIMLHLEIDKYEFDIYKVEKEYKINFDTHEFLKYLKRIHKHDIIELRIEENYLIIHIEGNTTKTFKQKLLDIDNITPPQPKITYPYTMKLPMNYFKEFIKDINEFSQRVIFTTTKDKHSVTFKSVDDYYEEVIIEYITDEKAHETFESVYEISHLLDMIKAEKFASKTYLHWGNNMPLLVEMKSENEKTNLNFLLAPMILD